MLEASAHPLAKLITLERHLPLSTRNFRHFFFLLYSIAVVWSLGYPATYSGQGSWSFIKVVPLSLIEAADQPPQPRGWGLPLELSDSAGDPVAVSGRC